MSDVLVPLAEAAGQLGVSAERVRQLVVAGDLAGRRIGNAWAVPKDAIDARGHVARPGGRPFGARRAWQEIIAGTVDLDRPGRYLRRARVVRCEMSGATFESLPQVASARIGGANAAIALGSSFAAPEGGDAYLSRAAFERLDAQVAVVFDAVGAVRLRVVDDAVWPLIPNGYLAPISAVALDLLDSADPRHWIAAKQLMSRA